MTSWTLNLKAMNYGKTPISVPANINKALVDSGSTLSRFPAPLYDGILKAICSNRVKCSTEGGVTYINQCDKVFHSFKELTITIDRQTYGMAAQSFLQYYISENGHHMCEVALRPLPKGAD